MSFLSKKIILHEKTVVERLGLAYDDKVHWKWSMSMAPFDGAWLMPNGSKLYRYSKRTWKVGGYSEWNFKQDLALIEGRC